MSGFEKSDPITDQLIATTLVQQRETQKMLNLRALKRAKQFLAISFVFAVAVAWFVFSGTQAGSLDILHGLLIVACLINIHTSLARYRSARAELVSTRDAA